jgi:hypothetical protein
MLGGCSSSTLIRWGNYLLSDLWALNQPVENLLSEIPPAYLQCTVRFGMIDKGIKKTDHFGRFRYWLPGELVLNA